MNYIEADIRKDYHELTNLLIEKGLTITTMESATSGQIASLITDTEGASAIFKGAFLTYSNEAKIQQGVPVDVIQTYGVYSKETASAMASAARAAFTADLGIGITGTMGNVDLMNSDSVPGQVYFAVAFKDKTHCYHKSIPVQSSRYAYKLAVAKEVVDAVFEILHQAF